MSWSKIKMGEFLINRESRFKPNDKAIAGLKRIDKIDFSGTIYLSDKPSNTDMIIVKKGDLVISGINVEKGAMSVYQGKEDVTATIHYSSYSFDEKKIDIEFLKMFLKSLEFKTALKEQVPGGIKTEIKPKHLLPLEVNIPTQISDQKEIVKRFTGIMKLSSSVDTEIINQQDLLTQLRQSFLREAMQGKLVKQDPKDGHAKDLLEKLKAEKAKSGKKKKEQPPIKLEEIPYEIPENWVWCRLGEVGNLSRGKSKHRPRNDECLFQGGEYPFIQTGDVARSKLTGFKIKTVNGYYNEFGLAQSLMQKKGTLCITIAANIAECGFLDFDACAPDSIVCFTSLDKSIERYVFYYLLDARDEIEKYAPATAQKNINLEILNSLIIPIPPLTSQKRIVNKLDELMNLCGRMQESIQTSRVQNELLLQQVLKEALIE